MRAVTVDLWHTLLWDPRADFPRAAHDHRVSETVENLRRLGKRLPRADVEGAYRRFLEDLRDIWRRYEDEPVGDRMARYAAALGMEWPDDELDAALRDAVGSALRRFPPTVSDGALEALRDVKERGVAIGLISNSGPTWGEAQGPVLRRAGLSGLLDVTTFSDEVGVRKPRAEIFERTLALLGAEPAEAVHIGDRILADVAGARGAGMKGVLYTHGEVPPDGYEGADAVLEHFSELPGILEGLE